ncbi:hypothetical protein MML48_9g00016678 [Holotrichia oblita]|uniref:Uncharacterized protein n=1 Tax=Holotrichia oblita TaxID=644536 RepID=A0ACB9SH28_HOLOL|nr:hypothetical protein MML48_9g00016678 [Holotrichia oblita]
MVRTYERTPGTRNHKNYTDEKVPRPTLQRKLLGRNLNPVGHLRVLSDEEEAIIRNTLGIVANWGFPLTRYDVRMLIGKYIEKQGKTVKLLRNNIPGTIYQYDWHPVSRDLERPLVRMIL